MQRKGPALARRGHDAWAPTVSEDSRGRRIISAGGTTLLLYQIHYGKASANELQPPWTPYWNRRLGPFFEAEVIAALVNDGQPTAAEYFGVFSRQFQAKIPLRAPEIFRRMHRDGFTSDVYTFFGRIKERHLWRLAERKHPGIIRAAQVLLQRLGIDVDLSAMEAPVIHQNHFICRSALYERFVGELLGPALRAMRNKADRPLQALLQQDAHYHDPRLTPARLRATFGKPHFCLHPFICERLFSTWLALNPTVRVRHIWRGRFVAAGNVRHEPEMKRVGLAP